MSGIPCIDIINNSNNSNNYNYNYTKNNNNNNLLKQHRTYMLQIAKSADVKILELKKLGACLSWSNKWVHVHESKIYLQTLLNITATISYLRALQDDCVYFKHEDSIMVGKSLVEYEPVHLRLWRRANRLATLDRIRSAAKRSARTRDADITAN